MKTIPNKPSSAPLQLAGVRIDRYTWETSLTTILDLLKKSVPTRVYWIYANCVNIVKNNPAYREAVNHAEFILNDGIGIELAGKLLNRRLPANLCGTDWLPAFLTQLNTEVTKTSLSAKLFLLGSTPMAIKQAKYQIEQRWPRLSVVGHVDGFLPTEQYPNLVEKIKLSQANILIVGMGVPRQELFIDQYWPILSTQGIVLAFAGGAIIDHFAGVVKRAPQWIRKLRLEWFYRLLTEPKRLGKRYTIGIITFIIIVLKERYGKTHRHTCH